jgi:hypothetical protein
MGWSSWSFIRHDPTAADIEAQAAAMASSLDIANAATWAEYSNGWRTGGDIECYCGSAGSSYPLTDWSNVQSRFATCGPAPRRARRPEASARRER